MKKRYIIAIILIASVLFTAFRASAKQQTMEEHTENAIEKADEILSGNMFERLLNKFVSGISSSVKDFSAVFASILFATFLLGMIRLMSENNAAEYAGEICLCALSFSVISGICTRLISFLETLHGFMLAALPSITALYTVSGAPVTASLNYGTTLILLNLCNTLFTSVIIPGIKCISVFAVVSFVSRSFDFSGIVSFVKNTVGWLFGLLMCLMSTVIAFQNIVSVSKDGILGRTVRFAASRFIPVIGNTVSESARTVSESLRLVRSVTGIGGIFSIVGIIAAPITSVLVCRFFMNMCAACARLFSCNKAAFFFGELSGALNLILGVVVGMSLVFVLILGIFAKSVIAV